MNKNNSSAWIWGGIFITVGIIWLLSNLFNIRIDMSVLWPIFILAPGIIFWMGYLFGSSHEVGLLIPANILTFMGLTFFFNTFTTQILGYDKTWLLTVSMYSTGPIAISFWIAWVASGRKKVYLIPAIVLTVISGCIASLTVPLALFDTNMFEGVVKFGWPLLIILCGVLILAGPIFGGLASKSSSWGEGFKDMMGEIGKEVQKEVKKEVEEAELVKKKSRKRRTKKS